MHLSIVGKLVSVVVLAMSACLVHAVEPIRIAMIEGMSGPFANAGEAVFRNSLWAVERVNARGGVAPVPDAATAACASDDVTASFAPGPLLIGPIRVMTTLVLVQHDDVNQTDHRSPRPG